MALRRLFARTPFRGAIEPRRKMPNAAREAAREVTGEVTAEETLGTVEMGRACAADAPQSLHIQEVPLVAKLVNKVATQLGGGAKARERAMGGAISIRIRDDFGVGAGGRAGRHPVGRFAIESQGASRECQLTLPHAWGPLETHSRPGSPKEFHLKGFQTSNFDSPFARPRFSWS